MNEIAKYGDMINEIKEVLQSARQNVAQQVNTELLTTYWNIGRIIVEHEQQSRERAEYGQQTLKELSRVLTKEFGKGFSRSNLQNMRAFYLTYQKCQTPSGKLSWSHYCELLSISDADTQSIALLYLLPQHYTAEDSAGDLDQRVQTIHKSLIIRAFHSCSFHSPLSSAAIFISDKSMS